MKKWQIVPLCLIVTIAGIGGGNGEAAGEVIKEANLSLSAGRRFDQLDWSIAGDITGQNPNILSELTWEDLEIFQVKAKGQVVLGSPRLPYFDAVLMGGVSYGWIDDGDNQDSDYIGDNRSLEFSRSNSSTEADNVIDINVGVGPRFTLGSGTLKISPLGGYSYHEQNLNITNGLQTVSRSDLDPDVVSLGPLTGLDSYYETQWYGPWAGIDLELASGNKLIVKGSFEYHWATFEAEADWNLRPDLAHPASFVHDADGEGIVVAATVTYDLWQHWAVEISGDYQDWQTDPGISRTYVVSPSPGVGVTRLNEVNWESYSLMLGITYRFL